MYTNCFSLVQMLKNIIDQKREINLLKIWKYMWERKKLPRWEIAVVTYKINFIVFKNYRKVFNYCLMVDEITEDVEMTNQLNNHFCDIEEKVSTNITSIILNHVLYLKSIINGIFFWHRLWKIRSWHNGSHLEAKMNVPWVCCWILPKYFTPVFTVYL